MGVATPVADKANGLSTVVNVITAPREAMETLRVAPTWGWALIVALILTAVGQFMATPAIAHAMQASWPAQVAASPQLAGMSPEQQQRALNVSVSVIRWSWLFSPIFLLVDGFLFTIVMLIFKAIGRSQAGFKQLWCASINICVVAVGFASLLGGLIAVVRGPSTYMSTADAYRAMPSLAWLAPHAAVKLSAFLAGFNVVSVWAAFLFATAMIYIARTSKLNAGLCGLLTICVGAGFLAFGAR